jgi:hypothetical protein
VKTLIFLTSLILPTSTDFLKPPFTHGCANPSECSLLRQDLSGSYDVTSATTHASAPPPLLRLRSVASIPPQYAYMLLRSYYFFFNDFSSQSVVKSSDGRFAISPQWQKPRVRPIERPTGLGLTSATFLASDRAQYRCGAQTFSLK